MRRFPPPIDAPSLAMVAMSVSLLVCWAIARLGGPVFPAEALAEWIMAHTPPDRANATLDRMGDIARPFALLGGLTFAAVFVTHGAIFLAIRTTDDIRRRAKLLASRSGLIEANHIRAFDPSCSLLNFPERAAIGQPGFSLERFLIISNCCDPVGSAECSLHLVQQLQSFRRRAFR